MSQSQLQRHHNHSNYAWWMTAAAAASTIAVVAATSFVYRRYNTSSSSGSGSTSSSTSTTTNNKNKNKNNTIEEQSRSRSQSRSQSQSQQIDELVQKRFDQCSKFMKSSIPNLSQQTQLEFYALFKQASTTTTTSTNNASNSTRGPPKNKFDLVAQAKYKAWKKLENMPRTEAMQQYIDKAVHVEFTKSMQQNDDAELEGDAIMEVSGLGIQPSTLIGDEKEIAEESAKYAQQYPLHHAARENKVDALQQLLMKEEQSNNASNTSNTVPTSNYSNYSNYSNALDDSGQTALHLAADAGHVEAIQVLCKFGANVNAADFDGISILQTAVIGGNAAVCQLLLSVGADPDQPDGDGDTPRACAQDDPTLKALLFSFRASSTSSSSSSQGQIETETEIDDPTFQKDELQQLERQKPSAAIVAVQTELQEHSPEPESTSFYEDAREFESDDGDADDATEDNVVNDDNVVNADDNDDIIMKIDKNDLAKLDQFDIQLDDDGDM